jgi:hypothetical protein
LGFFGQRACATSSVRVGLAVGAIPEWSGGEVGVMWERYSERSRDATGGHLPVSKPPGLDVGVFPHYFAFILVNWFSSFWDWLSEWLIELVDFGVLSFGLLIGCWYFALFVESLDSLIGWLSCFRVGLGSHSFARNMVFGGGGC